MLVCQKTDDPIVSNSINIDSPKKEAAVELSDWSNDSDFNIAKAKDVQSSESKGVILP